MAVRLSGLRSGRPPIWIKCQNKNIMLKVQTRTYGLPHVISLQRARRAVLIRHTPSCCFPLKFYTKQGRQPYGTIMSCQYTYIWVSRAIAEAVSRWLPTAAARVRAQVRSCGICGGQSGSTSVSPARHHSTDCSTLVIYDPGLVQ
jgi:hypothetical protein